MNFTNRDSNTQQSQPSRSNQGNSSSSTSTNIAGPLNGALKGGHGQKPRNWIKGTGIIMLVSLTIIVVGLVFLLHIANPSEGKFVNNTKLQAVFLENGQVYFGQIKSISEKYIDLQDIFYLNSSSSSSSSSSTPTNLSLVKLGCELHGPYDQMIINQSQVSFWENLRSDGQVAKAVAQFEQQNPNGQKCSTATSSSTNQATSNTQSSSSTTNPQSTSGSKQ